MTDLSLKCLGMEKLCPLQPTGLVAQAGAGIARVALIGPFALFALLTGPSAASARPWRGAITTMMALCEPSDAQRDLTTFGFPPPPYARPAPQDIQRLLFSRGTWSVGDFMRQWSMGTAWLAPQAAAWETLPLTRDQWNALGRDRKAQRCIDAARAASGWQAHQGPFIWLVVGHPFIDLFGSPNNAIAFVPQDVDTGAAAHELGHALGLNHSYSNLWPIQQTAAGSLVRPPIFGTPTRLAEYGDPWDVMSWGNQHAVPTGNGGGPAGITAPQLEYLGWLPTTRITSHGANGRDIATYCLAPLDEPLRPGWLMVRVPLSVGDPFTYLAIEHRSRTGWGAGVPANIGSTVRILRVTRQGASLRTTLVFTGPEPKPGDPWRPAREFAEGGVRVVTLRNQRQGDCSAQIQVRDSRVHNAFARAFLADILGPNRCAAGLVSRGLDPYDYVCVTRVNRSIYHRTGSRWLGLGPDGAFPGAFGCASGRVPREAFPGDDICVLPAERDGAARDNLAASARFELK